MRGRKPKHSNRTARGERSKKAPAKYRKRYSSYYLRLTVYERDAGQCQYCGLEVTFAGCNIDHILPYHAGGQTRQDNLVVACRECNKLKGSQIIPDGFGPRENAHDVLYDKLYLEGLEVQRHKNSQDMKDSIRLIRMAKETGVDLSGLFPGGMIERWQE